MKQLLCCLSFLFITHSITSQSCDGLLAISIHGSDTDEILAVESYTDGFVTCGRAHDYPSFSIVTEDLGTHSTYAFSNLTGYKAVAMELNYPELYLLCSDEARTSWVMIKMDLATIQYDWMVQMDHFDLIIPKQEMILYQNRLFVYGQIDNIILGCDAFLMEVDPANGNILYERSYSLGSCETFSHHVLLEDHFYFTGRYNNAGGGTSRMRHGVSKIDLQGNQVWSKLYSVNVNQDARLYSDAILAYQGDLIFSGRGDYNGTSADDVEVSFHRADIDGNVKNHVSYDIIGADRERIRRINEIDGDIILAGFYTESNNRNIFLFQTDAVGNLEYATALDIRSEDLVAEIIHRGSSLYVFGTSNDGLDSDRIMIRLNLPLNENSDCEYIVPIDVETIERLDFQLDHDFEHTPTSLNVSERTSSIQPWELELNVMCEIEGETEETINFNICPGEHVSVNNENYTQQGTYTQSLTSAQGCDSILTIQVFLDNQCDDCLIDHEQNRPDLVISKNKSGLANISFFHNGKEIVIQDINPQHLASVLEQFYAPDYNAMNVADAVQYIEKLKTHKDTESTVFSSRVNSLLRTFEILPVGRTIKAK